MSNSKADTAATSAPSAASAPVAKRGKLRAPLMLLNALLLTVLLRYGFAFLLVAILPSITAYLVDRAHEKPTFQVVFCCNVAGLLPYFAPLVATGSTLSSVQVLMFDPMVWLVIYGAAAVGWGLLSFCPWMVRGILQGSDAAETKLLESEQQSLLNEWGPEIQRREG